MRLFDVLHSSNSVEPIRPGQSVYNWVSESGFPENCRGRALLEEWFRCYPEEAKEELLARFRSDDANLDSAVFELYLFALLRACGFAVEAQVACGGSKPDLVLLRGGKRIACVEATVVRGVRSQKQQEEALHDLVGRASPLVEVPGFGILIRRCQPGHGNISPRRFVTFLNRWFSEKDHALARERFESSGESEEALFTDERSGWRITLGLWPLKAPDQRLKQVAGLIASGAWATGSRDRLKEEIRGKLRQHRGCDLPLVVAVAFNDPLTAPDREEVSEALVGSVVLTVSTRGDPKPAPRRKWDGIWCRSGRSWAADPIGVICTSACCIWSLDKIDVCLWDNPSLPENALLRPWPMTRAGWTQKDGNLAVCPGRTAGSILGIE